MTKEYLLQTMEDGRAFVIPEEFPCKNPDVIYVTKAVSKQHPQSVYLFREEEWQQFQEKLKALLLVTVSARQLAKYFWSNCYEVDIEDGVFRLPERLWNYLCGGEMSETARVHLALNVEEEPGDCKNLLWVEMEK